MKKVITMVGTSIFENYFEKNDNRAIKNFYDVLKNERAKNKEEEKDRISRLRKAIEEWVRKEENNENISAEIKSLVKLKEELEDELEIYLLCSDTILSELAGEIIKNILFKRFNISNVKMKIINGLQIWDRKEFLKGMSNLISEIYSIADEYWDNVIINITGGYKATVPFLTILAQINICLIFYIFEETDALIKIPNIPFSREWFDWDKLEKYEDYLKKLDNGITEKHEVQSLANSDFYKEYSFLVWIEDELAELNPIGKIIFHKYKEKFFELYATDEVFSLIQNNRNLMRLFQNQFSNREQRERKTEIKNGHYVYDAGDNQSRIFYRELEGKIYVYKVFNDHNKYVRYLNLSPFNEDIINPQNFKERKIKKEV